jgi:RecJ-like exonuclease
MNKTRLTFLVLAIVFSIISVVAAESQQDIISDHSKPIPICYYCHYVKGYSIGSFSSLEEACDKCHNIKNNINNLEQAHSQICSKCHNTPATPEAYHEMHNSVSCEKCHGNNTLPVRPGISRTNCAGCHGASVSFNGGGKIHEVHKAKLEIACPKCHGVSPSSKPSMLTSAKTQEQEKEILSTVYAKIIDYRKYTLYEIFKKLSSAF